MCDGGNVKGVVCMEEFVLHTCYADQIIGSIRYWVRIGDYGKGVRVSGPWGLVAAPR